MQPLVQIQNLKFHYYYLRALNYQMEWVRIIILFLILSIWEICEDDLSPFSRILSIHPLGLFWREKQVASPAHKAQSADIASKVLSYWSNVFFFIELLSNSNNMLLHNAKSQCISEISILFFCTAFLFFFEDFHSERYGTESLSSFSCFFFNSYNQLHSSYNSSI